MAGLAARSAGRSMSTVRGRVTRAVGAGLVSVTRAGCVAYVSGPL